MQILRRSDTVIAFQKAPVSLWLSKVVCQNLLENKKRADFGSKVFVSGTKSGSPCLVISLVTERAFTCCGQGDLRSIFVKYLL